MSAPNSPRPPTSDSPSPSPSLNDRDQVPLDPTPAALPLPMSASIVLSALPRDAHAALQEVDAKEVDAKGEDVKVRIRLSPLPMAPPLAQKTFKISRNNKFASVIAFLRKKLGLRREEGVFCYVNSVFAPGLDEGVGGLWDCFKTGVKGDEALVVGYSMTPAFG